MRPPISVQFNLFSKENSVQFISINFNLPKLGLGGLSILKLLGRVSIISIPGLHEKSLFAHTNLDPEVVIRDLSVK
jgi:hypothetical protein